MPYKIKALFRFLVYHLTPVSAVYYDAGDIEPDYGYAGYFTHKRFGVVAFFCHDGSLQFEW